MPQLSKATLQEIDNANQPRADRPAVAVQFNPASLRLQFTNQSEGGRSAGRQAQQHTGNSSVTLTVELVFDTADEGSTASPRSVLERTREVETFIKPQGGALRNQAPPRLRFHWGDIIVDGVLESLSIDIDHFAHTGTPLRAKASLSIKGQDPERQANRSGAGANTAVGQPASGVPPAPAAPGAGMAAGLAAGIGAGLRSLASASSVAQALEGESLAQMALRNGLPPEAWRALGAGVADPTRLPAGREVALPGAAQAGNGAGAAQGVQSGTQGAAAPTAAQRVGLGDSTPPGSSAALQRGYAMAAAGGLGAALETVRADTGAAAATRARRSFEGAGGSTAASVDALSAAATTPGQRQQVFSLRADPRAQAYGRNVPLRDRVGVAQDERANLLAGQAVLRRQNTPVPPTTSDPGVPGWVALPAATDVLAPRLHGRDCRCGCR
ncbi:MAG: hypothetical protein Q7U73_16260 [Rubrivivax sp.]|nr:hypothetical protein [Rubrivivax sp.]